MTTRSLTCSTLAATLGCLISTLVVLLNSPRAEAQALLYDNSDHLHSGAFGAGPRNIVWAGNEPGELFIAAPFHTGAHDNVASVSIPMARNLGHTATGTIRFSIWDDNGVGFPGLEVAELGVVNIDSLPRFDFSGTRGGPDPQIVANPLPSIDFDSFIDDLVPGETYFVYADLSDLSTFQFGDWLWGVSTTAGASRVSDLLISTPGSTAPLEASDWVPFGTFFAERYFQMSVTSEDPPYIPIICPVDTTYHENFNVLGSDGETTTLMPRGWAFSDYSRATDFDGRALTDEERVMRVDTKVYDSSVTDPFPIGASLGGGTPVFNAGIPNDADRALAMGVSRTTEDGMFQLVAQVAGGDANSVHLTFDIETWDAANRRDRPGEAAFNVALDLDTGDGFEQIIDLGLVTTGATLEPPSDEIVNGNDEANRTSFDSGLLSAHLPEGSLLRVRWMADLDANTTGWVFGLDNVSLGMFAQEVMSLVGDYNGNGLVEQGDLDLVLLNWGEELANPVAAGWTNGVPDGAVDQGELDAVLLNWGSSAPLAAGSVPEPSAAVLFVLAAAATLWSHRHVRRGFALCRSCRSEYGGDALGFISPSER